MSASTKNPTSERCYALRFISGKYQGGEFPLPTDGEIVLGRSSELDVVLVEDMVSRQHAKISVSGPHVTIQDLGSTNGTFVNGERVSSAQLSEGDRILVGTSIIKVVVSTQPAAPHKRKRTLEEVAAGRRRTSQVKTMSGLINEIGLTDLLQLFAASRKSGTLVVRTDHDTGKIYIDNGAVVYASINDAQGVAPLKSLLRILLWEEGSFDMEPLEPVPTTNRLEMSTEALLLESMRQIDETKQLQVNMPPRHAVLSLNLPLREPLANLSPQELDILQLAHNQGEFQRVLDVSPTTDLETSQILIKLLAKGYLKSGS
jgi:pSer/pThr/pTyr-binding forkhead associated (FHA) protein